VIFGRTNPNSRDKSDAVGPLGLLVSRTLFRTLGGSSFVARKDRPGECPRPGWQLLAGCGKRGLRGDRGPPGPGAAQLRNVTFDTNIGGLVFRTDAGRVAELRLTEIFGAIKIDREAFAVIVTMANGEELTRVPLGSGPSTSAPATGTISEVCATPISASPLATTSAAWGPATKIVLD
jgi:hypothetical protein